LERFEAFNNFKNFYAILLDREQLESNCGGFLKGHSSTISRLVMTKSQDFFYSLGLNDNTMIEWKGYKIVKKMYFLYFFSYFSQLIMSVIILILKKMQMKKKT